MLRLPFTALQRTVIGTVKNHHLWRRFVAVIDRHRPRVNDVAMHGRPNRGARDVGLLGIVVEATRPVDEVGPGLISHRRVAQERLRDGRVARVEVGYCATGRVLQVFMLRDMEVAAAEPRSM